MGYFALLLFSLLAFKSAAQEAVSGESYCTNKGKLVIFASTQQQLDSGLSLCADPTSVHLKLYQTSFDLENLGALISAKCLSIEFPKLEKGNSDYGLRSMKVFDCSILENLTELEFLIIDWQGELIEVEKILDLPKLVFARLPISAFGPMLFRENSSVVQFEFGDAYDISISRRENLRSLSFPDVNYEDFLTVGNRRLKRFIKKSKVGDKKNWPNRILVVSELGDTLLETTNRREEHFSWHFSISQMGIDYRGKYNEKKRTITRNLSWMSYEKMMFLQGEGQYRLTQIKKTSYSDTTPLWIKEVGFKNGIQHGVFSETSRGFLQYKRVYDEGELVYRYGYEDSIPLIRVGFPVQYELQHLYAPYKEVFYKDNLPTLVRAYSGRIDDSRTLMRLEIPYEDGEVHGKMSIFNSVGDTMIAEFVNGKLHGDYYHFGISHGDTIRTKVTYVNNKPEGNTIRTTNKTTTKGFYSNSKMQYMLTYVNETKTKLVEIIWYPEKGYSETKNWDFNGVLCRIHRNDENGKMIFEKVYVDCGANVPPPPP